MTKSLTQQEITAIINLLTDVAMRGKRRDADPAMILFYEQLRDKIRPFYGADGVHIFSDYTKG